MRPLDVLSLFIARPMLSNSLLLNFCRCWDPLEATSLYMEIRQRDITNSDIFGSDNLDHADVLLQQEGLWTKPMNSS